MTAENRAAIGSVMNQANIMVLITFHLPCLVTAPRPNKLPQDTCVVETGIPNLEATVTSSAVIKFAVKPCP